jgi:polyphosphate glucokinase
MRKTSKTENTSQVSTLVIDIGGTGIKMMVLDAAAKPITERLREPTPTPANPKALLSLIERMKKQLPAFDRVSVGFPGVVKHGRTMTAHNLDPGWIDFPLEATLARKWKTQVRLCNDAAVQGYGAIAGEGVELCLTLGTGLGSSLFTDGRLCPGLELAHHPWRNGKTYEDHLGRDGLKHHGKKRWNKLVERAVEQTQSLFNWDTLYIGGGNAEKVDFTLPECVKIVSNNDGLLGGVALWRDNP